MNKVLLLFLLACSVSYGQGLYPAGARSMSMANASVTLNDAWSHFNNPGAIGEVENFTAGLNYENRFLLKELQSQAFAAAIPLKAGVVSAGGQMFGYRDFRTYKAGVGYGLKLSEKLFAGVQMNYLGLQLNNAYGSKHTISGDLGVLGKITDHWLFGVSVNNLFRAKLAEYQDDRFTTKMRFGSSYILSDKAIIAGEVEKDITNPMRFKAGIEYKPIKNFCIRGGVATAPVELSFGIGYKAEVITIDVGSSYHQILGWSPHFGLTFVNNK